MRQPGATGYPGQGLGWVNHEPLSPLGAPTPTHLLPEHFLYLFLKGRPVECFPWGVGLPRASPVLSNTGAPSHQIS